MKLLPSSVQQVSIALACSFVLLATTHVSAHNIITKTTSTPNVAPGGIATYTIKNDAVGTSSPVNQIQVRDALPAGFTYLSTTSVTLLNINSTRTSVLNPVVGDVAPIWGTFNNILASGGAPAGAFQIVFNAQLAATVPCGAYTNTVTKVVNDTSNDHTNSNAVNVASVTVAGPAPTLVVTKVANAPTIVVPGGAASYSLKVTNTAAAGSCPATGVSLADALPAGFTYASTGAIVLNGGAIRPTSTTPAVGASAPAWGGFTIPPGGSVDLTFTAAVGAAVNAGTYSNSARATTTATGATITNFVGSTNTVDDVVILPTTLTVRKSTNGAGTAGVSSPATFSFTSNNGGIFTPVATTSADIFASAGTVTLTNFNTATVITETPPAGSTWVMTGAICTDTNAAVSGNPANTNLATFNAATGAVTIPAANIKSAAQISCDITNTRRTLEVKKTVVKASTDATNYQFDLLQAGVVQASNVGNNGTTTPLAVASGAITFGEDAKPPNNTLTAFNIFWQCTNGDGTVLATSGGVVPAATTGDGAVAFSGLVMPATGTPAQLAVTCTITNTRVAMLTFVKSADPADATPFAISSTFSGGIGATANPTMAAGFSLTGSTPGNQIDIDILNNGTLDQTGTYTVKETLTAAQISAGWDPDFIKITCQSTNAAANGISSLTAPPYSIAVPVTGGSRTVCTIFNRKLGTITVKKVLVPAADPAKFDLSVGTTTVATAVGNGGSGLENAIAGVPVTVAEIASGATVLSNYDSSLSCVDAATNAAVGVASNAGTSGSITTGVGQSIVCTFTNTKKNATVTLAKTWSGATINDTVSVTATGLTSLNSVANIASETDTGQAQIVTSGSVITLAENYTTGEPAQYTSTLACTGNTNPLVGNVLTVAPADTAVVCTYSNTLAPKKIDVAKAVGVVTQVSALAFQVPYSIVLKNTDAVTYASNVQVSDNLSAVFAAGSPVITLSSPATTASPCNINSTTFNGTTNAFLLSGADTLAPGATCTISFTALITYPNAGAIPTTPQNNTATAGVYPTAPSAGGVPTGTALASDSSSNGASPTAGDTPGATPVSFVPQKIDTVKAAGTVMQIGTLVFDVPYSIVVKNTGTVAATNVQVSDNLVSTFASPAIVSLSTPASVSGGACNINSSAFNGTSNIYLLSGTDSLAAGVSCTISFTARVTYPNAGAIPTVAQNNSATAGVYPTAPGAGGVPTGTALASDNSSNGASPIAGDTAGATPVSFVPQKIDTVKGVGVPKQLGPKVFEINYSVVVANVCKTAPLSCATTPSVYNVQANDNLANTFPTAASIVVSNYAVASGANGALCTAASPAFAGTAATSAMLSGTNDLTGGQTCIITFKAIVDFGANAIPTVSQNNMVYASGTGADSIANLGYTYAADGKPIAPSNASTTDASTTAPPTTGAPGTLPTTPLPPTIAGADTDAGVPTPLILVIEEDGELSINKSTPTKVGAAGDVVLYTVSISNTSSNPVKSKVTDTPPVGFEYISGSAKLGGSSIANPSSANGSSLVFDIGTIPAKTTVVLTYQMKLGDAVEAGDATNCVSANGVNTLTGNDKESGKSCANVVIKTGLFLEKRANVNKAELGDSVEYSLRVKSVGGTTKNVTIADNLPLGFKLIEGTVKVIRGGVTSTMSNPTGSPGPAVTYNIGTVVNKEIVEIRYRVRLGIGSDLGDGINRAQAKAPFATSSLVATAKILVTRGVFTREACVAGKVFVDCNQNAMQDKGELGIPSVRLYMEDGTNMTTDENGQYSICGVRAISHVMQVDTTTMPVGSRMGITSNRNLGDGVSLLMNIKAGELYRADFIEGSCTPSILEQVNQRIKPGSVTSSSSASSTPPKPLEFDSSQQGYSIPFLCTTQPDSIECKKAGGSK